MLLMFFNGLIQVIVLCICYVTKFIYLFCFVHFFSNPILISDHLPYMIVICPCLGCSKSVRINHKALYCDNCLQWVHLKCTKLTYNDYSNLSSDNNNWFCEICLSKICPFNSIVDEFEFVCCIYNNSYRDKINT